MKLQQSRQLLSFMASLKLEVDGRVQKAYFDKDFDYASKHFTPDLVASKLAKDMSGVLDSGITFSPDDQVGSGDIIRLTRILDLASTDTMAYKMLQLISLEVFALVTVEDIAPESADEYTITDANRLHENINYLIEYLQDKYSNNNSEIELETGVVVYHLIRALRELDVDSSYIYKTISGNTLGGANNAI